MTFLRDDSPISVNGDIPNGIPKCLKESSIFKLVGAGENDDDFPCFLLRNVTIYKQDGVTVGNLLNAEVEDPLYVQGQVDFDSEEENIEDCKLLLHVSVAHH